MIRTFRPWQIFEKLGNDNHLDLNIPIFPGTTTRTVFMLETALLVAAARIVKAQTILEIGTCMGYTAMHLAMNTDATVESLDIEQRPLIWQGTQYENRICSIIGTTSECSVDQTDMIFIDADHEYPWVKRDTEFAVECDPKVIAWHDYSNPMEPGVMKYLSEFAQKHNLIHVQDSWLCFWFKDDL